MADSVTVTRAGNRLVHLRIEWFADREDRLEHFASEGLEELRTSRQHAFECLLLRLGLWLERGSRIERVKRRQKALDDPL